MTLSKPNKMMNSYSGKVGIEVGSQQFTVRNLTVNNANVGEWGLSCM